MLLLYSKYYLSNIINDTPRILTNTSADYYVFR
jgi:hypothetical protein